MNYPTQAAIIIVFSLGLVLSYPSLMHPPLRRAWAKFFRLVAWPFRGIWPAFLWIFRTPIEEFRLQKEIPQLVKVAEENEQKLAEAAGRMWLETQLYPHKPRNVIGKADRDHAALNTLRQDLVDETYGIPVREEDWYQKHEETSRRPPLDLWWQLGLWSSWAVWKTLAGIFIASYAIPRRIPAFRKLTVIGLRKLHRDWDSLLEQQDTLLDDMETIPERTKIYDRLESAKELKRREREEQSALLRPLKSAEIAFEGVKGYIHELQLRRRHGPTKGSAVLSLERVLEEWQARVHAIEQTQANGSTPEELIEAIRALERDMALAGSHAVKVVQVERRAQRIQSMHKRLKRRYRGTKLPDAELEVVVSGIRNGLAGLWVSARWEELTEALDKTMQDIQVYEYVVLSRVWHLHAGTFDQLVKAVFWPGSTADAPDMRLNPELDEGRRRAVEGSSDVSPFAGRVHEHEKEDSARFVKWR